VLIPTVRIAHFSFINKYIARRIYREKYYVKSVKACTDVNSINKNPSSTIVKLGGTFVFVSGLETNRYHSLKILNVPVCHFVTPPRTNKHSK
jgi:hypothetical protein